MTSPAVLHAALVAVLDALPTVGAYNGQVPPSPPADDLTGQVYPYVVVWGTAGWTPDDARTLSGGADGALDWPSRVTVAAGDLGWCLEAAHLVRQALEGRELIEGAGPLREDPIDLGVQKDEDATPPRWYVPLIFRCQTP